MSNLISPVQAPGGGQEGPDNHFGGRRACGEQRGRQGSRAEGEQKITIRGRCRWQVKMQGEMSREDEGRR